MINCNNCGRVNDGTTRICRYCGTVLGNRRESTDVRDYAPPSAHGVGQAPPGPQGVEAYSAPGMVAGGYRCPNCASTSPPVSAKKISMEGWIVFAALLIFCLPLFWVGLLMKEEQRFCPMCRARVS